MSFYLNTRKFITDLINNNLDTLIILIADLESSLAKKLEYIIETIIDKDLFKRYSDKKQSLKEKISNKNLRYIYPLIPII